MNRKSVSRLERKAAVCDRVSSACFILIPAFAIASMILACFIAGGAKGLTGFLRCFVYLFIFVFAIGFISPGLYGKYKDKAARLSAPLWYFLEKNNVPQKDIEEIIAELES
jgi:hypothetical protein